MARTTPGYLGPYRLLNVIHTSHSGQIWQAMDDGRQQMVAVKTLLAKCANSAEQFGYLRCEYKVGRVVHDPRVLAVLGFGIDRGLPYLATEWFSAPNLKRRIRGKDDREKLVPLLPKIIEEAAAGLAALHEHRWVHRDIKPDNFLVDDQGQVKLIDFGISRRARGGWARLFLGRSKRQGTPSYMAPEQIRCAPPATSADVYSFACTVYEAIAGTPPFTGERLEDLLGKHLKSPPPSLEAADRRVTPEFAQLITRCLAKDPSLRPQSAADFLGVFGSLRVFKTLPRRPEPMT